MRNGVGFKLFKGYIRFFQSTVYYRKMYYLDQDHIPEKGPLMIVSDHQNSLNDALALLTAINKRKDKKLRIVARADVFRPGVKKALRWLGILPAFRLSYEGEEALSNNEGMFSEAEEELMNDGTLIIYPEAGHQDKHWLGKFSLGYLRLLFQTAEKSNFEKELFILPACNHYSDYFNFQEDVLIRFGTPISIAPFYELYKTKPRTAQRQVNALVREQISGMMLNITDLNNYDAIDYLRNSSFGIRYAGEKGLNPNKLPEKLLADKQLFADLEKAKEAHEEQVQNIYAKVRELDKAVKQAKLCDTVLDKKSSTLNLIGRGLLLLAFFPLFIFACIPNILVYYAPDTIIKKIKDVMFYGSFKIGMSVLITIPLLYTLTFVLTWVITKSFLIALIHLVSLPFLAIFAWYFAKGFRKWKQDLRYRNLCNKGKLNDIMALRTYIFESLHTLLK